MTGAVSPRFYKTKFGPILFIPYSFLSMECWKLFVLNWNLLLIQQDSSRMTEAVSPLFYKTKFGRIFFIPYSFFLSPSYHGKLCNSTEHISTNYKNNFSQAF